MSSHLIFQRKVSENKLLKWFKMELVMVRLRGEADKGRFKNGVYDN
jgi:hypothetical protein